MRLVIWIVVFGILAGVLFPVSAHAFRLVPCGTSEDKGTDDEICNFGHLIGILMRMINYLISVAGIVAMYNVLSRGWDLMTALGNPEKIQHAKEGISNAIVGFAMVVLAFVFINLVVNLVFGHPSAEQRKWWDPKCIYNITDFEGCKKLGGLTQFAPQRVYAQSNAADTTELTNPLEVNEPGQIVKKGFVGFAGVIGLVAIAFIVFSGFKLVLATEEEAINSAKQSLTWAVGGFIVALLAFTLVASTANIIGFDPSRVPFDKDTLVNPVPSSDPKVGAQGAGFFEVLTRLMTNVLGLLGFATTLMIIYYGYRYITSSGNEEAIEKAKTGLKWAITGFIIALLAFTIITAIRQKSVFDSAETGKQAQTGGNTGNNQNSAGGQSPALSASQTYNWTIPRIGYAKLSDGKISYNDFALTILSTNQQPTRASITIADDKGSVFTNNPVSKTLNKGEALLYAGLEHYPLNESANYSGVSVKVEASAPVYVVSPEIFRASGRGPDLLGAIKDGWWHGGSWTMTVPDALEGNDVFFPYYIHWHNFENWPEGWDTLITLTNNSAVAGVAKVEARTEYNTLWGDSKQCLVKPIGYGQYGGKKSKEYSLPPKTSKTFSIKEVLGITVDQSHHSEGTLAITLPDSKTWQVSEKVVSYPDGTKFCDAPK